MKPVSHSKSKNLLFILAFLLTLIFGVISFKNAYVYISVCVTVMILLSLYHDRNRDLISLFLILIASWLLVFVEAWTIKSEVLSSSLIFKVIVYCSTTLIAIIFRYQLLAKIILISLLVVVPVEIYWYQTGYSAPFIYYFYVGFCHTIAIRFAFLMRTALFRSWGANKPNNLDFNVSEVFVISAIVDLIMVTEYLIRHLSGVNILVVYNAYEYLQHICAVLIVLLMFYHTIIQPNAFNKPVHSQ
jgi:hypothetical protein